MNAIAKRRLGASAQRRIVADWEKPRDFSRGGRTTTVTQTYNSEARPAEKKHIHLREA
jgi:hypothetical protein